MILTFFDARSQIVTWLRPNQRSYCDVWNPNERSKPICDNNIIHPRKKGVRSGFAEGPIPVVPVNPVLYYYYFVFYILWHVVPGTSKGYRTSFIDCNTFYIVLYSRFPLWDRNYSFRGWTSGPLFLTVRGLRTPREEPLWTKFREIHVQSNNTKNNICFVVGSTKAQRRIRTGYPTVFGYAYLPCLFSSLLPIANITVNIYMYNFVASKWKEKSVIIII